MTKVELGTQENRTEYDEALEELGNNIGHHKARYETETARADINIALLRLFGPHAVIWLLAGAAYLVSNEAGQVATSLAAMGSLYGIFREP